MTKVIHAYKYFSSTRILYCRKFRPAYKEYKIAGNAVHFGPQTDVTCKQCLKRLEKLK